MKKFSKIIVFALAIMMLIPAFAASAATPYQTHTYMATGKNALNSPDAYVPVISVDAAYMGAAAFGDVSDLFVGPDNELYIVDSNKGTVVILDRYYKQVGTIQKFTNDQGVPDSLTGPKGVFVNEEHIYICDTNANRIVVFDRQQNASGGYDFVRIIQKPNSDLFGEDAIYKPIAMVVDTYGRLYVVSSSTYQGIIVMTEDGQFNGFIGAQQVSYDMLTMLWRRFMTKEQLEQMETLVSTEFNNIAITADNFIYCTTNNIEAADRRAAVSAKSGKYSPVKLLNPAGDEVMTRTGFYDPGGNLTGTSRIIDVAVGPEGTWTLISENESKCYTYDFNGNLLFAFGSAGSQLGNLKNVKACAYQEDKLILLDSSQKSFTVYKRTEYGDTLIAAIANTNARQYDKAIEYWEEILKRNSNYDAAYIGMGQSYYRGGEYEKAIEFFQAAYDTTNYSEAYREIRKAWLSKYILWIPVVAIAVCIFASKFSKYAKKVNDRTALKAGKRTYWEELLYVNHIIFHPFDGFWDLKHEKRGSVRAATTIVAVVIISFFYQSIGNGYVMNPFGTYSTIVSQFISVLVPLFLWVTANWCLTTLFDGEGSYKDIFVATGYALAPLPIFIICSTLLSNVATNSEKEFCTLLVSIGFAWALFLIFFGMQVTHDYSIGKNILISACTILGMAIIMAVCFLFVMLVQKMVGFVSNIIVELSYRM